MRRPQAIPAVDPVSQYLVLTGVSKSFGDVSVLESFDLSLAKGEFITLLGPSGCGKTTLLRLIAGLIRADKGSIVVAGTDLTRLPPHRRNIGMVFQSYALFPHMTVFDNVAFGLQARGISKADIAQRVMSALQLIRLEELARRSIKELSGGQQQRVSVARAVVVEPSLLLLDEPFSALDRKLRETMQIEMRQILRRIGATAIFVTHDQDEALVLSDRVVVMNRGQAEQVGTPAEIYAEPATPFVLDFVGQSAQLRGRIVAKDGRRARIDTALGPLSADTDLRPGSRVLVAVRPENFVLGASANGHENSLQAEIKETVFLGSKTQILFNTDADERLIAEVAGPLQGMAVGMTQRVSWPVHATLVYAEPV